MTIETKTRVLFFLLCISLNLTAQKEAYNWIYADENWFTFNVTPPVQISIPNNPDFSTEFSPISLSDKEGNLLFYSGNGRVFDKEHNEMVSDFSFQSSSIVTNPIFVIPKPESDSSYIIILNSAFDGSLGRYTVWFEVDMTLNNGLGNIVPNSITVLSNNTTDKLTAIRHSNGQDIWVIGHKSNSTEFNAWLTTSNGINEVPVVTPIGSLIGSSNENFSGQIKVSLDGTKIASVNRQLNNINIFDFDQNTGVLSNPFSFSELTNPQGIEFSPSGRFIYITELKPLVSNCRVVQIDLEAGDSMEIVNSLLEVGENTDGFCFNDVGGIQLGPNGKIYLTKGFGNKLNVINYPEQKGTACEFLEDEINSPNTKRGLPVFFHEYLQQPSFTYQGVCSSSTTSFMIDFYDNSIDSVFWNFGDSLSGSDNFSSNFAPSHDFFEAGTHQVTLTVYSNNKVYTVIQEIPIFPTEINLVDDKLVCDNEPFYVEMEIPHATYLWSNSSTESQIEINSPGEYWVEISRDTCPVLRDSIIIEHLMSPDFDLPPFVGICNGMSAILDVSTTSSNSYKWSTGEVTPTIEVSDFGEYYVTVTNANGCEKLDTTFVDFAIEIFVDPSQKNITCAGGSDGIALTFIDIGSGNPPFEYLWNDGTTSYRNDNLEAGNYSITVTDVAGCIFIQDFILTEPLAMTAGFVRIPDDSETATGEGQVLINVEGGESPYLFELEDLAITEDSIFMNLVEGDYNIIVTDSKGCKEEFTFVIESGNVDLNLDFIKVFPNPANNLLSIENIRNTKSRIGIYNLLGQEIFSTQTARNHSNLEINVSDWPVGIYFVFIEDKKDDLSKTWKIVVE